MKILLHTCCAPCLIYPLEELRKKSLEVKGLFFNPNIHPFAEYQKRKAAVEQFALSANLKVDFPEYAPEVFFRAVDFKETNPGRCVICWRMRLKKTAEHARQEGFEYFTSTLLVSPYQDQLSIKRIGEDIAKEYGVEFWYEDFRPGFRPAHMQAKKEGIYCQNYCGCIYSEIERFKGQSPVWRAVP